MGGSWQSLGCSDMSAALQVEGAAMSAQGETACLERDHAIRSASPKPWELHVSQHNSLQQRSLAILPAN